MKLYLAGPFFDDEQIDRIQRIEKALDNNPSVSEYFSPRNSNVNDGEEIGSSQWSKDVFQLDVDEIKKADAVIAIIDFVGDNVDSGTAFEIGYAYAIDKPVVLFHEKDAIVNLMLSNGSKSYLTKVSDVEKFDFQEMPEYHYEGEVF
ncbi:nucleoside 2-deoxyribosyltransferase [Apilactobacillus kunkeei]|uniref:nucleoside 2-deoxyribosyltransferase n=1 Tax=Apilactobacillus kunkeei TaxID=148814 RepID=UPI00110D1C7B|nr:nucleoside 2-deoxyribosyltransferase [Apilactobacillus kunkeei]TMS99267.1 nucleoside 2-deoxyribosyltransferase [Apilactobacillus kunkeei]